MIHVVLQKPERDPKCVHVTISPCRVFPSSLQIRPHFVTVMLIAYSRVSIRATASCSLFFDAAVFIPQGQTRFVSSSPYGRTHVWKHRQRKLPNPVVPQFPQIVIRSDGSSFVHHT